MGKRKEQVRVSFEGSLREKIEALREYYGIYNNTDLIRFLVAREYERLKEAGRL